MVIVDDEKIRKIQIIHQMIEKKKIMKTMKIIIEIQV
jgi:hypothetical protein